LWPFAGPDPKPSSKPVLHRAVAGKTGSDLMCALVLLLLWFDVEHACVGTDLERGAVPGDRGTHTLIRMDERNSLTKIRLMSYGFTPALAAPWEVNSSWIAPRH